ncbi:MAG TPA: ACT domain-containing protein [Candidatus Goldiibacteriota bacterium]|nr:ACT domain-containing protein [Candidatus Goldiibacteriota bacterium]
MKNYLLIAGGPDRKGVVFGLTGLLKRHGFNIEDSSMTMLRGTFSMIMLLTKDGKVNEALFEKDACGFMNSYQMSLEIREVDASRMKEKRGREAFLISISGADRPGIVNEISGKLFKAGVNITGLETKVPREKSPTPTTCSWKLTFPLKK